MTLGPFGPGCGCCSFCSTTWPTDFTDDFSAASLNAAWLGYFSRGDWSIVSSRLRYVKTPVWPDYSEPQTQSFLYRQVKTTGPSSTIKIGATLKALRTDTVSPWGYIQRIGVGWSVLSPWSGLGLFTSLGLRNSGTFLAAESYQNLDGNPTQDETRYVLVSSGGAPIAIGGAAPAVGDVLEITLSNFRGFTTAYPSTAVCDIAAKINGTTRYSRSPWFVGVDICSTFVGAYGLEWWTQGSGSAGTRAEIDDFYYSGL